MKLLKGQRTLELARILLDKTPKTQEIKGKLDKRNYSKLEGGTAKAASECAEPTRRERGKPGSHTPRTLSLVIQRGRS